MNPVAEEIDTLIHYGVKRRSGRYPYGSGENPYQHSGDLLSRVDELRAQNFTWTDEKTGRTYTGDLAIAKSMGLSSTQFRVKMSLAKDERRQLMVDHVKSLKSDGYSNSEIARMMGFNNESSVRSLLNENAEVRMKQARTTADFLKEAVDKKGMIYVGKGVNIELGISNEKLDEALYLLELEGYPTYGGRVPQPTNPGQQTTITVLCPPGTEHKDIYDYGKISSLQDYEQRLTEDGTKIRPAFEYPASLDSKRLAINYKEDGGTNKDGVIELRRGVRDISLGESNYSQVRILVDGTHYLKGMAVYADDLPEGIDVRFNTNKSRDVGMKGALKKIKDDPENPFGATLKEHGGQSYWLDDDGVEHLSLINKKSDEGDWISWSNSLPAQFLSKQNIKLINRQLDLDITDRKNEYDEICALTNPTVKKNLLRSFAEDCDSAAVHLSAAALPRQKYQVILPLASAKDNEIYAPNFKDGETVALIRFPHGGTFEIPILKVNNKIKEGRDIYGTSIKDAVGINSTVASILSGADFDGDTVMVIPCNSANSSIKISNRPPFEELKGFDNKMTYGYDKEVVDSEGYSHYYRNGIEFKPMKNTQNEMGRISNLINDMTIKGAEDSEVVRAVRHSMVVIDAEKHHLDYKASERDNGIAELKRRYQGHYDENGKYHEGTSTLLSSAKSPVDVLKSTGQPKTNLKDKPWYDPSRPEGSLIYNRVEEKYVDKNGKTRVRTQRSTKMAETDDAFTLVSDTNSAEERAYARYANTMKSLANEARKEIYSTGRIKYNKTAKEAYSKEVAELNADLKLVLANKPKETQAVLYANSVIKAKIQENPALADDKKALKKERQRQMVAARQKFGASRVSINITDKQWEAIQAGAISENVLSQILERADPDRVRELATPRSNNTISDAKIAKIKAMKSSGYTSSEIADAVKCSSATIAKYL